MRQSSLLGGGGGRRNDRQRRLGGISYATANRGKNQPNSRYLGDKNRHTRVTNFGQPTKFCSKAYRRQFDGTYRSYAAESTWQTQVTGWPKLSEGVKVIVCPLIASA